MHRLGQFTPHPPTATTGANISTATTARQSSGVHGVQGRTNYNNSNANNNNNNVNNNTRVTTAVGNTNSSGGATYDSGGRTHNTTPYPHNRGGGRGVDGVGGRRGNVVGTCQKNFSSADEVQSNSGFHPGTTSSKHTNNNKNKNNITPVIIQDSDISSDSDCGSGSGGCPEDQADESPVLSPVSPDSSTALSTVATTVLRKKLGQKAKCLSTDTMDSGIRSVKL